MQPAQKDLQLRGNGTPDRRSRIMERGSWSLPVKCVCSMVERFHGINTLISSLAPKHGS